VTTTVRFGRILAALAISAFPIAAMAAATTTSTWTAPDLQPTTYKKVVVLAKFTDDSALRILEDTIVKGLKDRTIEAVQAYLVLTPADLASDEAIEAKALELGADAGLVFTVTGENTEVKSGSHVSASVGVPVHVGPFGVFLGTSVPLGGGPSTVKKVGVKAQFFAKDAKGPLWIGTYTTDLKGGTERAAKDVASLVLKALKKAGLFAK